MTNDKCMTSWMRFRKIVMMMMVVVVVMVVAGHWRGGFKVQIERLSSYERLSVRPFERVSWEVLSKWIGLDWIGKESLSSESLSWKLGPIRSLRFCRSFDTPRVVEVNGTA